MALFKIFASGGSKWKGQLVHCHYGDKEKCFPATWTYIPDSIQEQCRKSNILDKRVTRIFAFSLQLSVNPSSATKELFAHFLVELETDDGYAVTFEKNSEIILIQSCRHSGETDRPVRRLGNGKKRKNLETMKEIGTKTPSRYPVIKIADVLRMMQSTEQLDIEYHVVEANCQEFVKKVWNVVTSDPFPVIREFTNIPIYEDAKGKKVSVDQKGKDPKEDKFRRSEVSSMSDQSHPVHRQSSTEIPRESGDTSLPDSRRKGSSVIRRTTTVDGDGNTVTTVETVGGDANNSVKTVETTTLDGKTANGDGNNTDIGMDDLDHEFANLLGGNVLGVGSPQIRQSFSLERGLLGPISSPRSLVSQRSSTLTGFRQPTSSSQLRRNFDFDF